MKILVLFYGVFGVEYTLFEMEGERELARGIIEGIGTKTAINTYKYPNGETEHTVKEVNNPVSAIKWILHTLTSKTVIKNVEEIDAIGHRVIHGGTKYSRATIINNEVLNDVVDFSDLAPEHNPFNAQGIKASSQVFPSTPQVAVFDTAFYSTLKPEVYLYGLPYQFYTQYGIRKYGFHGIGHLCAAVEVSKLIHRSLKRMRIISLHIGRGSSITAIDKGEAVDTSMGFSPTGGLLMKTRCGDIDPLIVIYLAAKENLSLIGVENILNKNSGILGLAGTTSLKELAEKAEKGEKRAVCALNAFVYRIQKYFGGYYVSMGGVDAFVLTSRDDDSVPLIRSKIIKKLEFLGLKLDEKKNEKCCDKTMEISTRNSKVKIFFVPRNEELCIARETKEVVK